MPGTQSPAQTPNLPDPARLPRSYAQTRRNFLIGSLAAGAGLALYSNEISRHELELTERTFYIRNLPKAFDGFAFAQISDLHLEAFTEDFFLKEVIIRVNALSPDLVLITGDFCSRGPLPIKYSLPAAVRCAELLAGITCPQRFGILGNHDAVVGPREIVRALERNNIPMLVNQYLPLERRGERIWLGGLDDVIAGNPNLDQALPSEARRDNAPVILMCHEPDYLQKIRVHPRGVNVDLVLSGHTHGGQVRLPGGGPLLLPPGGMLYPEGHFVLGNLQLYVNRGLGTVGLPFRLNCPPEITYATLRPA